MSQPQSSFSSWSFPFFSICGVHVRVHWLFLIWGVFQVMPLDGNWPIRLIFMTVLFGSVLLHEFGHVAACRSVGGRANHIMLFPLGGWAECAPPLNPWASLWTTLGGPLVNVLLMGLSAGAVAFLQSKAGLENPLSLTPWAMIDGETKSASLLVTWACIAYELNYMLVLYNMLLLCYPMDGAQALHEFLWTKFGYARSLWWVTHLSLLVGGLMVVWGASGFLGAGIHYGVLDAFMGFILMMGILNMLSNWRRRKELALVRQHYGSWSAIPDPRDTAIVGGPLGRLFGCRPPVVAAVTEKDVSAALNPNQEEIDRILRKVSEFGMASLTEEELATLRGGDSSN